ncbi:cytochrome P450 [Paraphoma chrysanthemicola]|nr:cytochrome P450 [Paraphoma chrysanthemicola]
MTSIGFQGISDISWLSAAAIVAFATFVSLLFTVLYRLIFHPLAAHPGPLLARCTSWYAAYQSYTGNIHLDILRCHELYGDVVRYRPNGLLFNTVEGLQDIYVHHNRTKKARGYASFRGDGHVSIINAIDKDEHAPRRRILSRAFSIAALQRYEPLIVNTAKKFCDSLLGQFSDNKNGHWWGPSLNMGELSSYFTFDVMSSVIFYSPQDLIAKAHGRSIIPGIESTMFLCGVSLEQPLLEDFPVLKKLLFADHCERARSFTTKVKQFTMERVALQEAQPVDDIFGSLLGSETMKDSEKTLTPIELAADATVMMIAGTDTSSVAISGVFFYLSRNLDDYARLASEIRTTFTSEEDIRPGSELAGCLFLRACIDESMRLAPPVAAPLWREMRYQDAVAGVKLPKGVDAATCIYSIHRNPAYFKDPNEFRPTRWLPEFEGDTQVESAKKAFAAFSLGSRGCIGKNLAYLEMTTVLAQIIYRAEWKVAGGTLGKVGETSIGENGAVDYKIKSHFTSEKVGPFIQIKSRDLEGSSTT